MKMNIEDVFIYAEMGISEQIERIKKEMGEIEFYRYLGRSTEEQEERYKKLSVGLGDWKKKIASLKRTARENNIRIL